jgi:hypothetical protein
MEPTCSSMLHLLDPVFFWCWCDIASSFPHEVVLLGRMWAVVTGSWVEIWSCSFRDHAMSPVEVYLCSSRNSKLFIMLMLCWQ